MKKSASLLERLIWLTPIALLAVVAVIAIQPARRDRPADEFLATPVPSDPAPAATTSPEPLIEPVPATPRPAGYPPPPTSRFPPGYPVPTPIPTLSPEEAAAQEATGLAQRATGEAEATNFTSTLLAQLPSPTPPPVVGPACYRDNVNEFSLVLPAGWYGDWGGGSGYAFITNYDPLTAPGNGGPLAPGLVKVTVGMARLAPDQTFDQWLSSRIALYASSADIPQPTVSPPEPFNLGKFSGVSFKISGYGGDYREIVLQPDNDRVFHIGLWPADSSSESEALAIFAESLSVTAKEGCRTN